jgi:hypothetical protein
MIDIEFPHPFNTPIKEEIEVEKVQPKFDPVTQKATFENITVKETVTTTYHRVVPYSIACEDKNHDWYMADIGRYIASCTKCTKNRILLPIRHKLEGGHICDRDSGRILE